MSIRLKMFLTTAVILVFVLGLITVAFYMFDVVKIKSERKKYSDIIARATQDLFFALGQSNTLQTYEEREQLREILLRSALLKNWIVVDQNLNTVVISHPSPSTLISAHKTALQNAFSRNEYVLEGSDLVMVASAPNGQLYGMVIELDHLGVPDVYASKFVTTIIPIMALGILLIFLNIYVHLKNIVIDPLKLVVDASVRVTKGDYTTLIAKLPRNDEFATVIETFNSMVISLQDYRSNMEARIAQIVEKIHNTEKNLIIAQRLSAMGTLAAGIAHEINNPLAGMLNAVNSLKKKNLSPEKTEQYLDIVNDGLLRIEGIVKKVLSFAPASAAPREVSLADAASRALLLLQHSINGKQITVQNNIPPDAPPVIGDQGELQQVFLNVLMNAVDAINEPGRKITLEARAVDNNVEVAVSDGGAGMDENELARIFDLFYSTKPPGKGTGLGLSIAHTIITSHNGKISVQSKKNQGTIVTISLPVTNV